MLHCWEKSWRAHCPVSPSPAPQWDWGPRQTQLSLNFHLQEWLLHSSSFSSPHPWRCPQILPFSHTGSNSSSYRVGCPLKTDPETNHSLPPLLRSISCLECLTEQVNRSWNPAQLHSLKGRAFLQDYIIWTKGTLFNLYQDVPADRQPPHVLAHFTPRKKAKIQQWGLCMTWPCCFCDAASFYLGPTGLDESQMPPARSCLKAFVISVLFV